MAEFRNAVMGSSSRQQVIIDVEDIEDLTRPFEDHLQNQDSLPSDVKTLAEPMKVPRWKEMEHEEEVESGRCMCGYWYRSTSHPTFNHGEFFPRPYRRNRSLLPAERVFGFEFNVETDFPEGEDKIFVWEPVLFRARSSHFVCSLASSKTELWLWVAMTMSRTGLDYSGFTYRLTVWNKENREELGYVGKTHSLSTKPEDVLNSGDCLIIVDKAVKNLACKGVLQALLQIDWEGGRTGAKEK